jgi:alpha-1,3-rhamnosyl/mannosyltransferase
MSRLHQLHQQGKVHYLGYISESEKWMLLHAAHALVFPSLYEGFGLPILEAFAANLPVITSNITAIPEVTGNAAILINPLEISEIKQAMIRISESHELRQDLQQKGQRVAKAHSWEACAKKTIAVYQHVLNQKIL